MAIPLYLLMQPLSLPIYTLILFLLTLAGIMLCHQTAKDLGVHDHPSTAFDEILGFLVTMLNAPAGWQWIATGFILFRLFDITKPWPIKWADKNVQGGFGIVLDDLIAGLYAFALIQILHLSL